MNKDFYDKLLRVESAILEREKEIMKKYELPSNVPGWGVFIDQVVYKCFDCYKKSGKITHAMMNEWIGNFKDMITTSKRFELMGEGKFEKKEPKKPKPYPFKPLILQFLPHQ